MASSIEIEKASSVAIISCSGTLRLDESLRAADELWASPEWPGRSAVWDFRAARFDLAASDVREIAAYVLENQRDDPPARMAFVAPHDVDFGLARMFEVFRDDPRTAFHVFRDLEEALLWARSPETGAA